MPSYTQYKRQVAVLDDDNDIESWITVHGNHIPIKKGQSKEDAVKSFIESKGGNTAKGSNQKSELGIIYHKDKGHIKEGRPPKDWTKVEGGTTAPNGYSWYSNNKSMFGGERESYLYKDEPEDTNIESKEGQKTDTYTYKKGEEVEFYTDVMHDDLAKGKIVGFERSMASHGNKAENQYIIKMPDGSTRTVNEKQIDWAKAKETSVETRVKKAREFETKTGISPEDYEAYEQVRESGAYNMFDYGAVSRETGLPKDAIRKIQENYTEARKVYGEE